MKRIFTLMLLAVGVVAMLVMTGCTGGKDKATSTAKHLNIALRWFGDSVDPANGWDAWTVSRIGAGENLVTVNEKMEFTPQLADKWENVDPVTWKLHIRQGVKFQNGDAMTPELVKASLERVIKENTRAAKLANIKEIRLDGENIVIETTRPSSSLIPVLTEPMFAIINTKADMTKVATAPVLTGPYMITDFKKGEEIKLKRNEHYWNGKPALDTVNAYHVGDDSKRAMGLQAGEFDLIQQVTAPNRSLFENKPEYMLYEVAGTRNLMLSLNLKGVLGNADLRNAIAYMLDYDFLAKVYGSSQPAGEPFPPSVSYGHAGVRTTKDTARSEAAFAAAGYAKNASGMYEKNGEVLTLRFATWGTQNAFYEAIESQLREGGIKVNMVHIKEPDRTEEAGGFDLLEENFNVVTTNDPYSWLTNMFYSTGTSNRSGYANPDFDQLVDDIGIAMDNKRKNELTEMAAKQLVEDKPVLFLAFPTITIAGKKKVKNVTPFPMDYYFMTKDITVE